MGSRGSVIWKWKALVDEGKPISVTDEEATRYWLEMPTLLETIETAISAGCGGEIMMPKMPTFNVIELAALIQNNDQKGIGISGLRKGEKRHEILIAGHERWFEWGDFYTIKSDYAYYAKTEWRYEEVVSHINDWWLTQTEMREKIDKLCQRDVRSGNAQTV